jgi:putative transposase
MAGRRHAPLLLTTEERQELERRVAARTSSQQAAYRAQIILRAADGGTDAHVAKALGRAVRTVWHWRQRFMERRLAGLDDRPKCPPPRTYTADRQAQLVVLACQKPGEVDPSWAGPTHWSIQTLAQYVRAHPDLGLGAPSKSTLGVILQRHQLRLDRL